MHGIYLSLKAKLQPTVLILKNQTFMKKYTYTQNYMSVLAHSIVAIKQNVNEVIHFISLDTILMQVSNLTVKTLMTCHLAIIRLYRFMA